MAAREERNTVMSAHAPGCIMLQALLLWGTDNNQPLFDKAATGFETPCSFNWVGVHSGCFFFWCSKMLPKPGTDQTSWPKIFLRGLWQQGSACQCLSFLPIARYANTSQWSVSRRHWRHQLPCGRGQTKATGRRVLRSWTGLRTSREDQHTISGEMLRSAGLLHLVCIPQPSTGGKSLVENSTFAPFRSDEGRDKGRVLSNSVELALKKGLYVSFG